MTDSAANKPEESVSRVRHYADILNPLFWDDAFYAIERMFEFVCTLVRASGLKDKGWDSYTESIDLLNDLGHLQELELPGDKFPLPSHTRARFALIAYSHAVEMDFPYELLANLLRLRLKLKYSVRPLSHLDRPIEKKHNGKKIITKILRASPDRKITEIEELSKKAGLPDVGNALRGIYNSTIRNAVYHSDYAIHENSLRLLSGNWLSKRQRIYTPLIPFDDLAEITNEAMAFHSALYLLWKRARNSFTDFRGKFMPYDQHYKAIIEFTFEGDTLTGFRTYWPNGTLGVSGRGISGESYAQNIRFEPDGSINFFVGILASKRSEFAPCVEDGSEPVYACVPGTDKRPYWPTSLAPYEL